MALLHALAFMHVHVNAANDYFADLSVSMYCWPRTGYGPLCVLLLVVACLFFTPPLPLNAAYSSL